MARNLTKGEILSQAIAINDMLRGEGRGEKVDTVVIMGSGEPLMNYENVLGFIRLLHEEYVLGLSYRSITISTSGIVPQMYKLADEGIPISLSVSLHAPNQELRSELMPINRKYPLADVVRAARHYAETTKSTSSSITSMTGRRRQENSSHCCAASWPASISSPSILWLSVICCARLPHASTGSSTTSRRII